MCWKRAWKCPVPAPALRALPATVAAGQAAGQAALRKLRPRCNQPSDSMPSPPPLCQGVYYEARVTDIDPSTRTLTCVKEYCEVRRGPWEGFSRTPRQLLVIRAVDAAWLPGEACAAHACRAGSPGGPLRART